MSPNDRFRMFSEGLTQPKAEPLPLNGGESPSNVLPFFDPEETQPIRTKAGSGPVLVTIRPVDGGFIVESSETLSGEALSILVDLLSGM